MSQALHFLTIAEASKLIAARKISPVELTQAYLDRIQQLDNQVNAFITVTAERALQSARNAEQEISRGNYRGPLHGIPFALKDIYDTAGILTSGHSRICIDNVPANNATAVQRLYDAGAVLLGKLAMHELAGGGFSLDLPWPPARNPWNTAYFTGGSSSGAGAAVAAGFTPFALGTDTGGSIRSPAALCGVVGLKPTYGRVSRHGVIPDSFTFDHCGPLTWTVEDSAIVLQCIAGHDTQDPTSSRRAVPDYHAALSSDIRGVRVGLVRHFWENEEPIAEETKAAIERAIEVFTKLGATISEARMRTRQEYSDIKMIISKAEILAVHEKDLRDRPGDFSSDFLGRNLPACLFLATDYVKAQRERRNMIEEMRPLYEKFDVLLTASSAPASRLDTLVGKNYAQRWETPNIYSPFSLTGGPALVLCNGYSIQGLPLAMQIAGRPFDEVTVLRVGHAYEQATQWRTYRPALQAGMEAPPLASPEQTTFIAAVDESIKRLVRAGVNRAGFKLDESQLQLLYRVAPAAIATAERIRRDRPRGDEPGDVFCFTDEVWP